MIIHNDPLYNIPRVFVNLCLILYLICTILPSCNHVNVMCARPNLRRKPHTSYYYHYNNPALGPLARGGRPPYEQVQSFIANNSDEDIDSDIKIMMRSLKPLKRRKRQSDEQTEEDVIAEEEVKHKTSSKELEISKDLPKLELRSNDSVNNRSRTVFVRPATISNYVLRNCGTSKKLAERIVNGQEAEEGTYPWVAAILKNGDSWCGGSILNKNWIITASHCFMSNLDPKSYVVRVGSVNRNSGSSYKVKKIVMHGRFHLDNMFNSDIALLKLERPLRLNDNVNGICLPTVPYEEPKTTQLIVVGWGATKYQNTDLPVLLQEVTLDRISDGACSMRYKAKHNVIYKSQICTWSKGKDACQGDSGGPAIEIQNNRAVLIGIISYGSKCADQMPGVYTQVSYFLNWIVARIEEN